MERGLPARIKTERGLPARIETERGLPARIEADMDEQLKEQTVKLSVPDAEPAQPLQPISKTAIEPKVALIPRVALGFAYLLFVIGAVISLGTFLIFGTTSAVELALPLWFHEIQLALLCVLLFAGVPLMALAGYQLAHIFRNSELNTQQKISWSFMTFAGILTLLPIPTIVYLKAHALGSSRSKLEIRQAKARRPGLIAAFICTFIYCAICLQTFSPGGYHFLHVFYLSGLTFFIAWMPIFFVQSLLPSQEKTKVRAEAEQITRQLMESAIGSWDVFSVKPSASDALLDFIAHTPIEDRWCVHKERLGRLVSIRSIHIKRNSIGMWMFVGAECHAHVSVQATFEKGDAQIDFKLLRANEQPWRVHAIFVKPNSER